MKLRNILSTGALCVGALCAQSSATGGQTWTGILADASCSSTDMATSTPMTRQTTMDQGTSMRDPKGPKIPDQNADMPVVTNGTSGQSQRSRDMKPTTPLDSEKSRVPTEATGEASRTPLGVDTQAGNNSTGDLANTSKWDKSCFVSKKSNSFSFQTNGRVLHFDSASNEMIKSKLDSTNRVAGKNKIFRARVKGELNGDTIHITDITL